VDGSTTLTVNPRYGAATTSGSTVATTVLASCGNGFINPGENCENCPADVSCAVGQQCCPGGICFDATLNCPSIE